MKVEYHYEEHEKADGFFYATVTMEDMEMDPVKIQVNVYSSDPEDYEADFLTGGMEYLKFGYLEIENLTVKLYEVAEEIIRRESMLSSQRNAKPV